MKLTIFCIFFILLLIILLVNKRIVRSNNRENFFIEKLDIKKKVIVVIMDGIMSESNYKLLSDNICNKLINNCSVIYDKDIIHSKKTINVTNDMSFKTSKKKKNVCYIVVYKNDKTNKYNKKFIKKWCGSNNKKKDNYILVDYDTIYMDSPKVLKEIGEKLDITLDINSLISTFT